MPDISGGTCPLTDIKKFKPVAEKAAGFLRRQTPPHKNPFLIDKQLPGGDTNNFSAEHASGSTSQAANIMEAVDSGAKLLLMDEDRSATSFMIRGRMMKELVEKEPITPLPTV